MPAQFTLPPDTRAVGTGNPPADMNGVVDTLTAQGAVYNVLNATYSGGADPTGSADSTTAIQAALTAAPAGTTVYVPGTPTGAAYKCGALTMPPGVTLLFASNAKFVAPSTLAASWIKAQAVVHTGTAIIGGTFDATATTSTSVTAVIDFSAVTSCPDLRIDANRIINAPVHGIYATELTGNFTATKKWITRNSIEGHGVAATGYGIYADYLGNVEIDSNYVTGAGASDAIELGHAGPANLSGLNASMTCSNNVIVGGELNFPFSDYAQIIGNKVVSKGIVNDLNTANWVTIADNLVLNCPPPAGYAGIRVAGNYATITGNQVNVTTGDGISVTSGSTGGTISGNAIYSSNSGSQTGSALNDNGATLLAIAGNICDGVSAHGFAAGVTITGGGHTVTGNVFNTGCFNGINDSGSGSTFTGNNLNVNNAPVQGLATSSRAAGNNHYNPVGVVSPAVPASTVAVAAVGYDRTFYVTTAAGVSTFAIQGGPTITIPATGFGTVRVPATKTLTPTYTNAPTWVVEGE